ncbi:MAG: hypothetical protein HY901_21015, partial [Deltaproteobacteria bacterium]|nr:hypothetical protein [Deltaproteobacteria bacterium]
MQEQDDIDEARREFLVRVHHQVWLACSRFIMPLLLASYGFHCWTNPCWQSFALVAGIFGMVVFWFVGSRLARRGNIQAAVWMLGGSSIGLALEVLVLRRGSEMTTAVALLTLFTYIALFSDRALRLAIGITVPLFVGGLVVGHFGLVPQIAQTPVRETVYRVVYIVVFFPIAAYFLRAGQRINEAMYGALRTSSLRKLQVLDAVGRVQPELDQALAAIGPMADTFAASAAQ